MATHPADPTATATPYPDPARLTVRQVAAALGVSANLVYLLCAAGRLQHERHGFGRGTIRVTPAALDDYRRRCTRGERSHPARPVVTPPPPRPRHVRMRP